MKRIILTVACCFIAFAAGRLTAPVGTLTLGTGANLQGPFVMSNGCTTVEDGAHNVSIGLGRFEGSWGCRTSAWDYVAAVIGRRS